MALFHVRVNYFKNVVGCAANGAAKYNELDDINPAFTALNPCNQRLMASQFFCHINLCQASSLSFRNKFLAERFLP
tara:strand:+ start:337 stop:564 length:228 start_codon:yes stop_codon:yes gene_type:complete